MINKILSKTLIFLGFIISFFIFLATADNIHNDNSENSILLFSCAIISGLLLLLITKLFSKPLKQAWFLIILLPIAFGIRLFWILNVNTPIISDFLVLYNAANSITEGIYDFSSSQYFLTWVYQLGFTFYQAVVLFIFNHQVLALKLFNVAFSLGIIVCLYFTGKQLFNESVGRIAAILYTFYIPNIMYASVLTNQHIATFLFYLSFYLLITKLRSSRFAWIYIGTLLSVANVMRPLAPVVIIAIIIYFLLNLLTKDEVSGKEKLYCISKYLIGILVIFVLVGKLISSAFIAGGLTAYPLESRDPYWKFVLGFNAETSGQYSRNDTDLIFSLPLGEERNEISKQLIMERIEDKSQLIELFKEKFKLMWGSKDDSVYWSLGAFDEENIMGFDRIKLMENLNITDQVFYLLIIFFSAVAFVFLFIKKQTEYPYSLYLLLIVGYIIVHFLIEIQTRYRFFIMPAFILFAGYGLMKMAELLSLKKQKNQLH